VTHKDLFGDMHHSFSLFVSGMIRPAFQRGQGMVEYALILALIAVVVIIVLITQGHAISQLYSNIACGMRIGC
jgi:pilus assembly protein Flp/PilA